MSRDGFVRPQTRAYRGPVRRSDPGYGRGEIALFCPNCGGTDLLIGPGPNGFMCRTCGKHFILVDPAIPDDSKEYAVHSRGAVAAERIPRQEVRRVAWDVVMDGMDQDDTYRNTARDYYGPIYTELETDEAYLDPASAEYRFGLDTDIPNIELNYAFDRGYVDSLQRGDSLDIPGTPLSIKRTKNKRKGRKGRHRL